MELREYEARAQRFLNKYHLQLASAFKGGKCPTWCDGNHMHGDLYRVTIKRIDGESISFDYWNSLHDKAHGKRPTPYDILACISSDVNMPTTPDEVYEEFGEMKPSQATAVAEFAKKLQQFFTQPEQRDLSEIQ